MTAPQREATFIGVSPHPEFLALGDRLAMVRVDHPVLDSLFHGAPDMGWEGDGRLGLYSWPERSRFVLVRLELDGDYRVVTVVDSLRMLEPGDVNRLIRWLVAHDVRRGFDPAADVAAAEARAAAEVERKTAEWSEEEAAPRLAWALRRDLGQHMGGRRTVFPT